MIELSVEHFAICAGVGFAAGTLGGLLGIGGSVVLIPGLAFAFGTANPESQHLYQASAMAVNIAVSLPAALRHRKAGAIRADLFKILLVSAAIAIVLGVLASNMVSGLILRRMFAVFLAYIALANIVKLARKTPDHPPEQAKVTWPRAAPAGGVMGFAAGMLGIGGGIIGIPIMQAMCRLPLRQCIGASAAVMTLTALVGATLKIATIPEHGYPISDALLLAALLAPTAVLGSRLGAGLTHRLPLPAVQTVLIVLLAVSVWRMGFH
ncbi:MAG: sulfite exporter TauE/SafE family protein [Phycisphaerales bacterium]